MSARHGLVVGVIAAIAITAVYAINGSYNSPTPKPAPTPTPTSRTVPVVLLNCEDGERQAGTTCVTFDEGVYTLSNDKVNVALPVNPVLVADRFMVSMPACHTEDDNNCIWTGAPDGHPGKGKAYIDVKGRLFSLTQKQLFG